MKKKIIYLLLLSLTTVYFLNRHLIRPYVYKNIENNDIKFIFGIIPNFLGAIILFIFFRYILQNSVKYVFFFINIYAICHEIINHLCDKIQFDPFDISATLLATILMSLVDWKITSWKTIQEPESLVDKLFKIK
jgi:hypothetical protein